MSKIEALSGYNGRRADPPLVIEEIEEPEIEVSEPTSYVSTIDEEFDILDFKLSEKEYKDLQLLVQKLKESKVRVDGMTTGVFIATKILGWEPIGNTYWYGENYPIGDIRSFDPIINEFQAKKVCKAIGIRYPGDSISACIAVLSWYNENKLSKGKDKPNNHVFM